MRVKHAVREGRDLRCGSEARHRVDDVGQAQRVAGPERVHGVSTARVHDVRAVRRHDRLTGADASSEGCPQGDPSRSEGSGGIVRGKINNSVVRFGSTEADREGVRRGIGHRLAVGCRIQLRETVQRCDVNLKCCRYCCCSCYSISRQVGPIERLPDDPINRLSGVHADGFRLLSRFLLNANVVVWKVYINGVTPPLEGRSERLLRICFWARIDSWEKRQNADGEQPVPRDQLGLTDPPAEFFSLDVGTKQGLGHERLVNKPFDCAGHD